MVSEMGLYCNNKPLELALDKSCWLYIQDGQIASAPRFVNGKRDQIIGVLTYHGNEPHCRPMCRVSFNPLSPGNLPRYRVLKQNGHCRNLLPREAHGDLGEKFVLESTSDPANTLELVITASEVKASEEWPPNRLPKRH